jgi:hypothetical protein
MKIDRKYFDGNVKLINDICEELKKYQDIDCNIEIKFSSGYKDARGFNLFSEVTRDVTEELHSGYATKNVTKTYERNIHDLTVYDNELSCYIRASGDYSLSHHIWVDIDEAPEVLKLLALFLISFDKKVHTISKKLEKLNI